MRYLERGSQALMLGAHEVDGEHATSGWKSKVQLIAKNGCFYVSSYEQDIISVTTI
jgi:hypothetical protein